jgi:hypothetical protein
VTCEDWATTFQTESRVSEEGNWRNLKVFLSAQSWYASLVVKRHLTQAVSFVACVRLAAWDRGPCAEVIEVEGGDRDCVHYLDVVVSAFEEPYWYL